MSDKKKDKSAHDRWVGYRPDIKILDCTLRDGGLVTDHQFDIGFAERIYKTCVAAGVDYMELGYKSSKKIYSRDEFGPMKFCDEDDLRDIVGENPSDMKLSVMVDTGRTDYKTDIIPKEDSVLDAVRVACYIHQVPLAIEIMQDSRDKGYEVTMQLMASSIIDKADLAAGLELVVNSELPTAIYVVDSFGALYSEQVRDITRIYNKVLDGSGIEIGFHAHNNQQLAFSNSIEAIINGANRIDATINGIGRGAGNCPLELLIGFLHNPKFKLRPVLECCNDIFMPLSKKIDWGYSLPYAITGQLNQHPRDAIKWRVGDTPDDCISFYDHMIEEVS